MHNIVSWMLSGGPRLQKHGVKLAKLLLEDALVKSGVDQITRLGDAGVAVSSVMFGTTVLVYLVMLMIWETNFFLATAFLLFFGLIDMVYTTGEIQGCCRTYFQPAAIQVDAMLDFAEAWCMPH